jgi:8-oxo-dGTP diphosphatase
MAKKPTCLLVVAGILRDRDGRMLLQQALPRKPHGHLWEFPGGKVEREENPRLALRRELHEELGVAVDEGLMMPVGFADDPTERGGPAIVLVLYECPSWQGEPQSREGQAWGWFTPAEASALPMPPIDRALLKVLLD